VDGSGKSEADVALQNMRTSHVPLNVSLFIGATFFVSNKLLPDIAAFTVLCEDKTEVVSNKEL